MQKKRGNTSLQSNRGTAMHADLLTQSTTTITTVVIKIHVCGDGSYQVCGQIGICCRAVQIVTENIHNDYITKYMGSTCLSSKEMRDNT